MKPFIVGLESTRLTQNEISFLREQKPWGVILFKRNCETPEGVMALTESIKNIYETEEVPILIDQEGGRVQRLKGKGWRDYASPAYFYTFFQRSPEIALDLIYLNASLQAAELRSMGITVNCAPMIDVRHTKADNIIGDRSFSEIPNEVTLYGKCVLKGFLEQKILSVAKHIPGHGRATCDSHKELPIITDSLQELLTDLKPFQELDYPLAMTAHILYEALDSKNCATLSVPIIKNIIRGVIGFTGLLMSDDISMKALTGDIQWLSQSLLHAGCDLVLHCNGNFQEMVQISEVITDDCPMLKFRTDKLWQSLFAHASPRHLIDLQEEYNSLLLKMTHGNKENF